MDGLLSPGPAHRPVCYMFRQCYFGHCGLHAAGLTETDVNPGSRPHTVHAWRAPRIRQPHFHVRDPPSSSTLTCCPSWRGLG